MLLILSLFLTVGGLVGLVLFALRPPTPVRRALLFAAIGVLHFGVGMLFIRVMPRGIVTTIAEVLIFGSAALFSLGAIRHYAALGTPTPR